MIYDLRKFTLFQIKRDSLLLHNAKPVLYKIACTILTFKRF